MKPAAACLLMAGWCVSGAALAHGGGLNAEGCHNNRKTGDYHCHRAPAVAAPSTPPKQEPPKQAVAGVAPAGVAPARLTCYTGPRGGTYTITASGKKNYGGC
jgi:hypothetical protein